MRDGNFAHLDGKETIPRNSNVITLLLSSIFSLLIKDNKKQVEHTHARILVWVGMEEWNSVSIYFA